METELKISSIEIADDKKSINVFTNISKEYYSSVNIYELRYQLWRIADIMDSIESRRFDESYAKEYFYYHEVIRPRDALKFQIIGICDFKIDESVKKKVSSITIQSNSSTFKIISRI